MQHTPTEIKEKLLKAVDKEYNVLDMGAVVEVISILERTPITKEALESTRLGKYVNELRRKTTNESLAKRAKDLVRQWRHLISPSESSTASISQASTTNHQKNGLNIPNRLGGALSPGLLCRDSTCSPYQSQKHSISPVLSSYYPAGGGSVASSRVSSISPTVSLSNEKGSSPSLQVHQSSSSVPRLGIKKQSTCPCSPVVTNSSQTKTVHGHRLDSPNVFQSVNLVLASESVPKTHVANKRLRKASPPLEDDLKKLERPNGEFINSTSLDVVGDCSRDSFGGNSDHGSLCWDVCIPPNNEVPKDNGLNVNKKRGCKRIVKGPKVKVARGDNTTSTILPSVDDIVKEKIASVARISKVKTTQELLAGLQAKTVQSSSSAEKLPGMNFPSTENKASLANCVLPTNRGSQSDALEISRNKTEHIAKFLRSQSGLDVNTAVTAATEPERSLKYAGDASIPADTSAPYKQSKEVNQSSCNEVYSCEPSVSSKDSRSVAFPNEDSADKVVNEILSRLPPIDYNAISWIESDKHVECTMVVTDSDTLSKLSTEHIEGVTGNYSHAKVSDSSNTFYEWHEPVSRRSYEGELLEILPYVVID